MAVVPGWQNLAYQAAVGVGMSPADAAVFVRKIGAESGGDDRALSPAGARGIAQFMPATAAGFGIDPFNVTQALRTSAIMDKRNLAKYGNWEDTLEAYNAGPGAVVRGGPPKYAETRAYVKKILGVAAKQKPTAPAYETPLPVPETAGFSLDPDVMGDVMEYLRTSERDAIAGRPGPGIDNILPRLIASLPTPGEAPPADTIARMAEGGGVPMKDPGYGWAEDLARRYGLRLPSTYRSPADNARVGGSKTSAHMHRGAAADFAGSPQAMRALADWAIKTGRFREVFYDPVGQWDNGRFSPRGIGGHDDHVHITY